MKHYTLFYDKALGFHTQINVRSPAQSFGVFLGLDNQTKQQVAIRKLKYDEAKGQTVLQRTQLLFGHQEEFMVRLLDFQIVPGGVLYLVTEFIDNHHHLSDLARLQISPNLQMIVKVGFAACSYYDWFVR